MFLTQEQRKTVLNTDFWKLDLAACAFSLVSLMTMNHSNIGQLDHSRVTPLTDHKMAQKLSWVFWLAAAWCSPQTWHMNLPERSAFGCRLRQWETLEDRTCQRHSTAPPFDCVRPCTTVNPVCAHKNVATWHAAACWISLCTHVAKAHTQSVFLRCKSVK